MKALGLGVLTGALVATVAAALVFALADRGVPVSGTRASAVGITPKNAEIEPNLEEITPNSEEITPNPEKADPTPRKADFAGRVAGSGGLVALSVRQGRAIGYFCDGRREVWLSGAAQDNRVTLVGTRNRKALLTADLGKGGAAGNLVLGEQAFRFTAPVVRRPSGLYRATQDVRGASVVGGWIVLPGGRQVGAVTTGGARQPAPRLTPGRTVQIGGVTLDPEYVDAFMEELVNG